MHFAKYYQPPDVSLWQGRADTPADSAIFQRIQCIDLRQPLQTNSGKLIFTLLGFACDEGILRNQGRTGAADGPDALRTALGKLALHRRESVVYDAGNIVCRDHDLEGAQQALGEAVSLLFAAGCTPIVVGGGHEMAWGHYQGIAAFYAAKTLGVVNFDAHFDMRPLGEGRKGSSGTPFLQIAKAHDEAGRQLDYTCIGIQLAGNTASLFDTAGSYGVSVLRADELYHHPSAGGKILARAIQANDIIYLSLCLDVFAADCAPGVSAPQPLGLMPQQVVPLLRQAAASGKVISYDIAELSPKFDSDSRTSRLAAHLIHEIIHHHVLTTEA